MAYRFHNYHNIVMARRLRPMNMPSTLQTVGRYYINRETTFII